MNKSTGSRRQRPWLLSELRPGMKIKHLPSGNEGKIMPHPDYPGRMYPSHGWGVPVVLTKGHLVRGTVWELRDLTADGRPVVPTRADLRAGVDPNKLHYGRTVWSVRGRPAVIAGEVTEQGRMGGLVDRLFVQVRIRSRRGKARLVLWSLKNIRLTPPRVIRAA